MRERGMTLVEIMVALFIVAIMMTFLMTIYVGTMRVRRRTEQVTEMNARARAAFELLRRDLQGAFRLADTIEGHEPGGEFHWCVPSGSKYLALSFISAVDGARGEDDLLRFYEYDVVAWYVRGGALVREVGKWRIPLASSDLPTGIEPVPAQGSDDVGIDVGVEVYTDLTAFQFENVGTYRGKPFISTSDSLYAQQSATPSEQVSLVRDLGGGVTEPAAAVFTYCFDEDVDLPAWAADFTPMPETIRANGIDYSLYAKEAPDGSFYLGPNEGDPGERMYFVIVEPMWWSLGEDAERLEFEPPAPPYLVQPSGDGPVPGYVDVTLVIEDLDAPDPLLRTRRFGERIWIPAGGGM